jgi:putative membrane protein
LYSNVPYDQWMQALTGWSPQQAFGWQRNNFDRLIHLLYGVCFAPALLHYFRQRWPLGPHQAFVLAVMTVMCSSLVYEWLEWAIALALSPEAAESYNGQQGDIWDAHADMLLATLGALVAWPRRQTGIRPIREAASS